jgi:hypothetical protein
MANKLSGPEKKERQLQKLLARIAQKHALRELDVEGVAAEEKKSDLKSTSRRRH